MLDTEVAVVRKPDAGYAGAPPWHPSTRYPEYAFADVATGTNDGYDLVRQSLILLGLDAPHAGTPQWNPLGALIAPGDTVLIKPNLVRHYHSRGGSLDVVLTHGSLIRAVIDYVVIALRGRGRVVIGDAPLQGADFDVVARTCGLPEIQEYYRRQGTSLEVMDFRAERSTTIPGSSIIRERIPLSGPPGGYRAVNVGSQSLLLPLDGQAERYRVTQYDPALMRQHHSGGTHEYLIPQAVLDADVVINMPKWKTHRKTGITCALKNLVGINGHKDWLPHHRRGSLGSGGDEYPGRNLVMDAAVSMIEWEAAQPSYLARLASVPISRTLLRLSRLVTRDGYREGSWHGNDTLWRTILDLNRLLLYADKSGVLQETPQRKHFAVVDGIIAGDGEGPLQPDVVQAGVVFAGSSVAAVDLVAAHLMGFDYRRLPVVANAFAMERLFDVPADGVRIHSNYEPWRGRALAVTDRLHFRPPAGWARHLSPGKA